jgi:ABC-type glycerol-3-phosphate transport system substrate-binding protein
MDRKGGRRGLRWLALSALVALLAVAAGCGGGSGDEGGEEAAPAATTAAAETGAAEETQPAETEAAAGGLGSEFDVASAGDVTVKLWWLGDLEAPGIEPWMDEMVAAFQSEYPNVTVETTLYETGKWVQTQQTACQSKSGPDLWYNWSGTWALEPAWKGCTVPNEEFLSQTDLDANPTVQETLWEGNTWNFPLYKFVYPVVANLDLIEQAGLDPNTPPATWDEWMAALEQIKGAGITPIALGLKDGFGGEIAAAGQLEKQWVNTPDDIKQLVIDGDFATAPGWTQWLDYTFQLQPYFNEDANSLGFAEGLALWQAGKTAMVFGAPGVQSVIKAAQEAGMNVGLLKMPAFGDGDWADSLINTGNGFQVTQWAENKEVAGAFLAFLQRPENLEKLYQATGNFPASSNWDPSTVTSGTDQLMLEWLGEKNTAWWAANYTPVDLDVNGTFVVFQKMMAGEIDAAGSAELYQDVMEKWRQANPDAVANFQSWLGS